MSPFSLGILGSARVAAGGPLAGYTAWYDFSDTATLTLSGSAITAAADKSGNGYTLTNATSGSPTTATSATFGANTLAFARFDGSNGTGLRNAADAGTTGSFTIISAARKQTSPATGSSADVLMMVRGLAAYITGVGGAESLAIWRGAAQTIVTTTTSLWTSPRVHTRTLNGSAHSYWIGTTNYVDAAAGGSGGAPAGVYVGGQDATNGSDWDVGEVLVYPSALSQSDRESVVSYLSTKWGI